MRTWAIKIKGLALGTILLCGCLLLTGCSALLNRSYSVETPHTQFTDEEKNADILRAENYEGIVTALLFLVSQGEESGTLRLYDYSGTVEQDLDAACLEVTQQDPLGAYAVDYIRYDLARVMSYHEVSLKLVYQRSWQQISEVSTVTGSTAIAGELREALEDFQKECVLKVSSFDPSMEAEQVAAMVVEAYNSVPQAAFGRPLVQVQLYPETPVGEQRLVEILLEYGRSEERV